MNNVSRFLSILQTVARITSVAGRDGYRCHISYTDGEQEDISPEIFRALAEIFRSLDARYHHHGPYDIWILQDADPAPQIQELARKKAETKAQRQAHARRRLAAWPDGTRYSSVIRQRELLRHGRQNGWQGQPAHHPTGDEDVKINSFRK